MWSSEQPGLVEDVPARGRGVGPRWSLRSLPTQTILWFCDSMFKKNTSALGSYMKVQQFSQSAKCTCSARRTKHLMPWLCRRTGDRATGFTPPRRGSFQLPRRASQLISSSEDHRWHRGSARQHAASDLLPARLKRALPCSYPSPIECGFFLRLARAAPWPARRSVLLRGSGRDSLWRRESELLPVTDGRQYS